MLPLALALLTVLQPPCSRVGYLPDAACTPGDIQTTDLVIICLRPIRELRRVELATRRAVFAEYGIPWSERGEWVLDHRVPLELGGANSIDNLWPQRKEEAHAKDRYENAAHRAVCAGRMTVEIAQEAFQGDWTKEMRP